MKKDVITMTVEYNGKTVNGTVDMADYDSLKELGIDPLAKLSTILIEDILKDIKNAE